MGHRSDTFNILIVGQTGRLQYEALLFLASLQKTNPNFRGKVVVATPEKGTKWPNNPNIKDENILNRIRELGGFVEAFDNVHFGHDYPYGNKIEALKVMPEEEPFIFFDTDTLILSDLAQIPFDFDRPSASLRRENTWPRQELYGPGYTAIWKSLYDRFGLNFESSLDRSHPDEYWQRYLYFNAGFFFYRCPKIFGARFADYAVEIRNNPPEALVCQSLDPWLDQVALPLVVHSLGGGRDSLPSGYLDGSHSCHYRTLPLLYARESDAVVEMLEAAAAPNRTKKLLKEYEPARRMIYQGKGAKARALFDQSALPQKEQVIRNRLKREKLWFR